MRKVFSRSYAEQNPRQMLPVWVSVFTGVDPILRVGWATKVAMGRLGGYRRRAQNG
jgi:hypothetical protein